MTGDSGPQVTRVETLADWHLVLALAPARQPLCLCLFEANPWKLSQRMSSLFLVAGCADFVM